MNISGLKSHIPWLAGGLAAGGVLGLAAGIFFFPFWFPPPEVNEAVDADLASLAQGTFIHANPSDGVHWGKGKVTIYAGGILHLEEDFEVGPGPKFHVYLTPDADIDTETRVQDTEFVDLGRLKAFSGSQNYRIPAGLDIRDYATVVIWCERFNVLISPAALQHQ